MRFDAYECVECGEWYGTIHGYKDTNGTIHLKCDRCGWIERIENQGTVVV